MNRKIIMLMAVIFVLSCEQSLTSVTDTEDDVLEDSEDIIKFKNAVVSMSEKFGIYTYTFDASADKITVTSSSGSIEEFAFDSITTCTPQTPTRIFTMPRGFYKNTSGDDYIGVVAFYINSQGLLLYRHTNLNTIFENNYCLP